MQTLWYIRRFPDEIEAYEEALTSTAINLDGMPRGGALSNPTMRDALKRAQLSLDIEPITRALLLIPDEYHGGILGNIIWRRPYPETANLKTWKKWRQRLIYWTAYFRGWI